MSPRAAARLESLGFAQVYDYVAGKADWGSAGLPLEGQSASESRAGAHVRRDVPTCATDERLQLVRARIGDWDTCFVLDADRILLGRLGRSALRREDDVSVADAMSEGPGTFRPSARLDRTVERMQRLNLSGVPVTTSDGRLVGLLRREDAEAALAGAAGGG